MPVVQTIRIAGVVAAVLLLNRGLEQKEIAYGQSEEAGLVGGLLATEVGLCSVWAVIARSHWLLRLAAVSAVPMSVWKFLHHWNPLSEKELLPGYWVQAVIVACTLLGLRCLGFRLVYVQTEASQEPGAPVPRYSIRDMMIFTTLVGIAVAAVVRLGSLQVGLDSPLICAAVGAFMASITLLSVLSTLMLRQSVLPALVTCGVGLLLAWGIATTIRYDRVVAMIVMGAPTGLQVAALILWRQAGYRFVRTGNVVDVPRSNFIGLAMAALFHEWSNWSGSVRCRPRQLLSPESEAGVVSIVRRAASDGQIVRVTGTGHSFTPLCARRRVAVARSPGGH